MTKALAVMIGLKALLFSVVALIATGLNLILHVVEGVPVMSPLGWLTTVCLVRVILFRGELVWDMEDEVL